MSFSHFRRHRLAFSPASSASLSPTESMPSQPISFQALTSSLVTPDVGERPKKKQGIASMIPSMLENDDDDEPAPNAVRVSFEEDKPDNAEQTNVAAGQGNRALPQYYDDVFNSRGPLNSPGATSVHDSIVVVEIKTNTKVKDEELRLVSNLSFRLAQIYQRPETSMMVAIQQNVCLHFGNSSLPAYLAKVLAHPYIIGPVTNMRNTILIQEAFREFLDIPSSRGVIIYTGVSEENFATNGITIMGEAVRISNEKQNDNSGFFKTITRTMSRKIKSNGSSNAPQSVGSSLVPAADSQPSEPASNGDSNQKGPTSASNDVQSQSVQRSRSLRDFVSRRTGDRGSNEQQE